MINYTKEYSQVKVISLQDLPDVVISFYCNLIGIDEDTGISVPVGFTVELPVVDPSTFVPFSSLTKEIMDGWVNEFGNVSYYTSIIEQSIYNIINPTVVVKPLPF